MRHELEQFEKEFGSAGRALSRLVRPAITAPEGKTLVWGDWSAVEARILPWLADTAGSRKVLDVFRTSDADPDAPDIYELEAANIFDKAAVDVIKAERQTGKVATLSLGFGGAVGALMAMAAGYGISLTQAEAAVIVEAWRSNNSWARRFWNELWEAFLNSMDNSGTLYTAGRVGFMYDPNYLSGTVFCFLPDGSNLTYPAVKWERKEVEDKHGVVTEKNVLTYRRGHTRRSLWYGEIANNVTQGTAGSLLRAALVVAEREMPDFVVGHTHDEMIGECDDTEQSVADNRAKLLDIMMTNPDWLPDCPLNADISDNFYYTKTID